MSASFDTVIRAFGNNSGIEVPAEILGQLGAGKRPRVRVRAGEYRFATTVAAMGGFGQLAPSRRKEFARQVSDAKAEQTRTRRIDKIVADLS